MEIKNPMSTENGRAGVLLAAISASVVIVLLVVWALVSHFSNKPNNSGESGVFSISQNDVQQVRNEAVLFTDTAASFGVKDGTLTDKKQTLNAQISINAKDGNASQYYYSRAQSFVDVKSNYLANGTPINESATIGTWDDSYERENLVSFKPENINVDVSNSGYYMNVNGTQAKALKSVVSFTSVEDLRTLESDDSSSNGIYDVFEKRMSIYANITMIYDTQDSLWKVYDVSIPSNDFPFVVSTWTPSDYSDQQDGLKKIGTIK